MSNGRSQPPSTANQGRDDKRAGRANKKPPESTPLLPAGAPTAAPATDHDQPYRKAPGGGGGGGGSAMALAALLIALLALAGVAGLGWWNMQKLTTAGEASAQAQELQRDQPVAELRSRLRELEILLADLRKESTQTQAGLDSLRALEARVEVVRQGLVQTREGVSGLRDDLDKNQLQLNTMSDMVAGRAEPDLVAIESLLMTANERLSVSRHPKAALNALRAADHRLTATNDPRLAEVHEQVHSAIAALEGLPDPNIEQLASALGALIKGVTDLPLASYVPTSDQITDSPGEPQTDGPTEGPASESFVTSMASALPPTLENFVNGLAQDLRSMVTIRNTKADYQLLIPPGQTLFLYQNLLLKLQTARLALLQGQSEVFHPSLSAAREWLRRYFADDNAAVAAAIDKLGQIEKTRIEWPSPDITTSLSLVRAYIGNHGVAGPSSGHAHETSTLSVPR